jgi:hypothetical protein
MAVARVSLKNVMDVSIYKRTNINKWLGHCNSHSALFRPHKWHCRPNYEALHILDGSVSRPFKLKKGDLTAAFFPIVYFNQKSVVNTIFLMQSYPIFSSRRIKCDFSGKYVTKIGEL